MTEEKKYIGDEAFLKLLRKSKSDISIDCIKGAILGAQASPETFGIEDVLRNLYSRSYNDLDSYLLEQFTCLWYYLYDNSKFPPSKHISPDLDNNNREYFIRFFQKQIEAAEEFLKYMNYGSLEDYKGEERFEKVLSIYFGNLDLLKSLKESLENKWTDKEFKKGVSFLNNLKGFIQVMWDTKVSLKEYSKRKKNEILKKKYLEQQNGNNRDKDTEH